MIRRRTIKSYKWTTVSGDGAVVLLNCARDFFRRLDLSGNSVQLVTTGKNLFDKNAVKQGYEFGSMGTDAETIKEGWFVSDFMPVKSGAKYFISGKTTGAGCKMYDKDKVFVKNIQAFSGVITIEDNITYFRINGEIKDLDLIQVEEGTVATDYEPYTGGKSSPSPEYMQEITSAGRKSKNLFDINYFKNKNNLQTIQCEGFSLLGITCNVKPNTEYTLSANVAEAKYNLNIANKTKRISLVLSPTRTLISNDDGTLYIGLFGVTADKVNMDDFTKQYKNIQLEEGNAATAYEPYGYLLELKVTGKNLFNIADLKVGQVKNDGTINEKATFYRTAILDVPEDGKYRITFAENNDYNLLYFTTLYINGVYSNPYVRVNGSALISLKKGENILTFVAQKDSTNIVFATDHNIMIAAEPETTAYEPYTEQTVQIALDEPLRGIGEYNDTITKDGIVRKIYPQYEVDLAKVSDGGYWKTNTVMFYARPPQKTIKFIDRKHSAKCNIFNDVALKMSNIYNYDEECIAVGGNLVLFRVNKSRLKDISSSEAAKQSFIEFMAGKKMIVEYALEEPTTEPLPESVQQQLQALHSENGTTHIFVDSGDVAAGISATYKTKL